MSLINAYKEVCDKPEAFKFYTSAGSGSGGRIFEFKNTNYRTIHSFIENYGTFKSGADGVERTSWEIGKHGQEALKQHTVNMLKSRLFSKNNEIYYHTKKGEVLDSIPNEFNDEEKWILLFLLLADGYFSDVPCYIIQTSKEWIENMVVYEIYKDDVKNSIVKFLNECKSADNYNFFEDDFLYYDSFHKTFEHVDFLKAYIYSTSKDKTELHKYITDNYATLKNLKKDKRLKGVNYDVVDFNSDIICKKYEPSGNYNKKMLIDDAKLIYMSSVVDGYSYHDFSAFCLHIVHEFKKIADIDSDTVLNFLHDYKDIFEMCFLNIYNPEYIDNTTTEDFKEEEYEKATKEITSNSVIETVDEAEKVSSLLKRKALERSRYRCALEDLFNCSDHYFTSKKTENNYLELHHLIPREFSNDFEKSIEQLENYVPLCPNCHRRMHLASDKEREPAINYLFNKRKSLLQEKGIEITLKDLLRYYKIKK